MFLLVEYRLSKFSDLQITDEISKLFNNQYSTEVISKIKDFYFNKCNNNCEIAKLENICHVSTVHW